MMLEYAPDAKADSTANHCCGKVEPVKTITSDPAEDAAFLAIPQPIFNFGCSGCDKGTCNAKCQPYQEADYDMLGTVAFSKPFEISCHNLSFITNRDFIDQKFYD